MSSLRISHQNRAFGALATAGDIGRSEHAEDGASFAMALGAAARVTPQGGTMLFGGQSDDASDGSPGSRKRSDTQASANDANAAATSIIGSLFAAPTVAVGAAGTAVGTSFVTDIATTTGAATPIGAVVATTLSPAPSLGEIGQTAPSRIVIADRGNPEPDVEPPPTSVPILSPSGAEPPIRTIAGGVVASALAAPATVSTVPASSALAGAMSPAPSGQDQATLTAATGQAPVAGQLIHNLAPAGMQIPDASVPPAGIAPPLAAVDATTDASGTSPPLVPALPATFVASGPHGLPSIASGTSPALPSLAVAQPAAANDGGAAGFAPRDRFAPTQTTQDGSSLLAAAGAANNAPPSAASAASPTPGLGLDPAGVGTLTDQVAGHLARMVTSGAREMVVQLHPPELGDLTVRVAVSGRDVSAWFASSQPQVQSAISAALGQLQTNLGNAGYNLNGAWVGADASSARQQQGSSVPAPPPSSASVAPVAALPAAAVSRPAASGLNIYV